MELFDSTKRRLYDVLKDVNTGKIQLFEFKTVDIKYINMEINQEIQKTNYQK